jgi:hypothetical protein
MTAPAQQPSFDCSETEDIYSVLCKREIHFVTNHLYRIGCSTAQDTRIGKLEKVSFDARIHALCKASWLVRQVFPIRWSLPIPTS